MVTYIVIGVVAIVVLFVIVVALQPNDFSEVVEERIIDTVLGCIVAFLAS